MLEISHITKDFVPPFSLGDIARFGFRRSASVRALDDVSFSLPKGKVLAILGPNGAGKTTLLKILSTLIIPDTGTVKINGFELGHDDDKIRSSIGLMTSTERSFYWRMTGKQNMEFFSTLYGLDKRTASASLAELSSLFGIDYQDRRFDYYSTGMQQKFSLMRALLHGPALLLLDEPTKSLDYAAAKSFRKLVKEELVARRGKTVVFTTHQMDEAAGFADLFMILHNGKAVATGTIDELSRVAGHTGAGLDEIFTKLTAEQ